MKKKLLFFSLILIKNIYIQTSEPSLLHQALKNMDYPAVKFLLRHKDNPALKGKIDPNECFENGTTPLMKVICDWNLEELKLPYVQLLLNHGANPNSENHNILYLALSYGYNRIAKLLLKHGADPDKTINDQNCFTLVRITLQDRDLYALLKEYKKPQTITIKRFY